MKKMLPVLAAIVGTLGSCTDGPPTTVEATPDASFSHLGSASAPDVYRVTLSELNGSGVRATATLRVTGDDLIVNLSAVGLVPDRVHPQHIHGFVGSASTCPTSAQDTNGDGIITIGEGSAAFGPVQVDLRPYSTPANAAAANHYANTFAFADLPLEPSELTQKTMVLHGAFVDGAYVASLPVACGFVEAVN